MLAKVAGQDRFKVGNGKSSWSELPWSPAVSGNNGLVYKDGELIVDFAQMPTDKFEALLKQLRLPIWLSEHTNVYINADTGSDVLSEGRGFSEDLPFKTIQFAVNYISNNYNLGNYNVMFYLHGTFYETVIVNTFNTINGVFQFRSYNGEYSGKIEQTFSYATGHWVTLWILTKNVQLYDIEIIGNSISEETTLSKYNSVISIEDKNTLVSLFGPHITLNVKTTGLNFVQSRLMNINGATVTIQPSNLYNCQFVIKGTAHKNGEIVIFFIADAAFVYILSTSESHRKTDMFVSTNAFNNVIAVNCNTNGYITIHTAWEYKMKFVILPGGSWTNCKKFYISTGGHIISNGLGQNYLPGTLDGQIEDAPISYFK